MDMVILYETTWFYIVSTYLHSIVAATAAQRVTVARPLGRLVAVAAGGTGSVHQRVRVTVVGRLLVVDQLRLLLSLDEAAARLLPRLVA